MSIQEFLLARVVQDETETDAHAASSAAFELGPNQQHRYATLEQRRSVILRHHDRSMTVTSAGKIETMTRCGVCVSETSRPCVALKTMARPYSGHPDYDKAWDLVLS